VYLTQDCKRRTISAVLKTIIKSPWAGAVGVVISWLWETACLIGPPIGIGEADKPKYVFWGMVAMLVCAVQAFGTLLQRNAKLHGELWEIKEATPTIKLKLPGAVHCIPVWQGPNIRVPFLRVRFWNDPPASYPKAVGKGVRAFVRFFPNGHSVSSLEVPARWSESDQPDTTKPHISTAPLEETTFSFGESKTVDIAYISSVDGRCYAWNNENYKYPGFLTPGHLLDAIGYCVEVRLRGEYLDETFKFHFWAKDGKFNFTQPS
jgi:hypothetical protein